MYYRNHNSSYFLGNETISSSWVGGGGWGIMSIGIEGPEMGLTGTGNKANRARDRPSPGPQSRKYCLGATLLNKRNISAMCDYGVQDCTWIYTIQYILVWESNH
jgi:hypothetical protein